MSEEKRENMKMDGRENEKSYMNRQADKFAGKQANRETHINLVGMSVSCTTHGYRKQKFEGELTEGIGLWNSYTRTAFAECNPQDVSVCLAIPPC